MDRVYMSKGLKRSLKEYWDDFPNIENILKYIIKKYQIDNANINSVTFDNNKLSFSLTDGKKKNPLVVCIFLNKNDFLVEKENMVEEYHYAYFEDNYVMVKRHYYNDTRDKLLIEEYVKYNGRPSFSCIYNGNTYDDYTYKFYNQDKTYDIIITIINGRKFNYTFLRDLVNTKNINNINDLYNYIVNALGTSNVNISINSFDTDELIVCQQGIVKAYKRHTIDTNKEYIINYLNEEFWTNHKTLSGVSDSDIEFVKKLVFAKKSFKE